MRPERVQDDAAAVPLVSDVATDRIASLDDRDRMACVPRQPRDRGAGEPGADDDECRVQPTAPRAGTRPRRRGRGYIARKG